MDEGLCGLGFHRCGPNRPIPTLASSAFFLGKSRVLGLPDRIYPLFVSRFVSTSLGFLPSGTFHTVAVRQG